MLRSVIEVQGYKSRQDWPPPPFPQHPPCLILPLPPSTAPQDALQSHHHPRHPSRRAHCHSGSRTQHPCPGPRRDAHPSPARLLRPPDGRQLVSTSAYSPCTTKSVAHSLNRVGRSYWDDTPPPCEQPGSTVDHSGACCNGLSKTDNELNAVIIKKGLGYATSKPDADKANVEATVIRKDGIDGEHGIDLSA